jgi:hypothetical protein
MDECMVGLTQQKENRMRLILTVAFGMIAALASSTVAQVATVTQMDLASLEGPKWTGMLTYVDYSSNKSTNIRSDVTVRRKPGDANVWVFSYEYPDEPKANSSAEVSLADGGRKFADASVVERKMTSDGKLQFVTTKPGTDNGRAALFRYSYVIGAKSFVVRKEVQFERTTEWFTRNEYNWSR